MAKQVIQLFRCGCKDNPSVVDGLDQRLSDLAASASRKTYLEAYSKYIALAKGCYSVLLLNAVKNLNLPYNGVRVPSTNNTFGVEETKIVNTNKITLVYIINELIKREAATKTIDNLILTDVVKALDCCPSVDFSKYYGLLGSVKSDNVDVYNQPVDVRVCGKNDRYQHLNSNTEFLALATTLGYSKLIDLLITLASVKVAVYAKR